MLIRVTSKGHRMLKAAKMVLWHLAENSWLVVAAMTTMTWDKMSETSEVRALKSDGERSRTPAGSGDLAVRMMSSAMGMAVEFSGSEWSQAA
jgi:hypothetical protein